MADFPDRSEYVPLSQRLSPGVSVGDQVMIRSADECIKSFHRHGSSKYVWIPDMEKGVCGNSMVVAKILKDDGMDVTGPWVAIEVPQQLYDPVSNGPIMSFYQEDQGLHVWFFHEDAVFTPYDLLLRSYSLLMLEMVGGMVKLIFEDLLNGVCQACYLIKKWHDMLPSARLFTICSLSCALIVSISGPIKKLIKAFRLKAKVADASKLEFLTEKSSPGDDEESQRGGHGKDWQQQEIPIIKEHSQDGTQDERIVIHEHRPADMDSFAFILQKQGQAPAAHGVLVFASILYWSSMGVIPIVFHDSLHCGGSVSAKQMFYFFAVVAMIHFMELFVMVQTVDGYIFFRSYLDRLHDSKKWIASLDCCLSILAKFDTFSDVTFTVLLCKCEPITWISIKGVVLHLPCELHKIAVFSLVVGVFAMQAIPGVTLLVLKKYLAVAFQLNEFRNLLGLVADYEDRSNRQARANLALADQYREQVAKATKVNYSHEKMIFERAPSRIKSEEFRSCTHGSLNFRTCATPCCLL